MLALLVGVPGFILARRRIRATRAFASANAGTEAEK
jgi:hypothetical protein